MNRYALIAVASLVTGGALTEIVHGYLLKIHANSPKKYSYSKPLAFTPWLINSVKGFERLSLVAYRDTKKYRSIGYGHRVGLSGPERCSVRQAERWLRKDLRWAHEAVMSAVKVPITQNQHDALVSFTFNVGAAGFKSSSVLAHLNRGDYKLAAVAMTRYVKADGKVSRGLVQRRQAEVSKFLQEELYG